MKARHRELYCENNNSTPPLIRITKAYATTSTAVLPVLAAVLPVDLLLEQLTAHFCIRRRKNFLFCEVEFRHQDYDDGEMDTTKALRTRVAEIIMNARNERWERFPKGRIHDELD